MGKTAIRNNQEVVKQLKDLILKGNAHATLEHALTDIPEAALGKVPAKLPYSLWQLAEHIRITQWDILEFSKDSNHQSPKWPDDYWPKEKAPKESNAFEKCVKQIKKDRKEFIALLEKEDVDLYTPFAHGQGQNLLREALLIADHTSYHVGEVIVIRRLLGIWK
jgi:DinB superfamily